MTRPETPPSDSRAARRARVGALTLGLIGIVWLAAMGERLAQRTSATMDEPGHLAAGISYWQNGTFALSTGNFFFTQKWAAWPLARHPSFPSPIAQRDWGWDTNRLGERFLATAGPHPSALLLPARRMTLLLALATAVAVAAWAHALGGGLAAGCAVFLFATSPVVVSHAALVTTDTGAALWCVVTLLLYDRVLARPHLLPATAAGAAAGCLALSKFAVPGVMFSAALMLGWHALKHRGFSAPLRLAACHATIVLVAWAVVWAFFTGMEPPAQTPVRVSARAGNVSPTGVVSAAVVRVADAGVLPPPFARDLVITSRMLSPRPGYLLGEFREGGHAFYFVVAFLAKSTVAMLLALPLAAKVRRQAAPDARNPGRSVAPVALAAGAYLVAASASGLNIGVRHILPVFALAAIVGGVALSRALGHAGVRRKLAIAILVLAGLEAAWAARRPMAWFNALAGGPMNGYRVLIDSSLEWGGDLPELVSWHQRLPARERARPLFVSVLGPPLHEAYGLQGEDLLTAFHRGHVQPGYFVFSATRLMGGAGASYGLGVAELKRDSAHLTPDARHRPLPVDDADLMTSRLAAFCRTRQPHARIGPVYFVFRLEAADLDLALAP